MATLRSINTNDLEFLLMLDKKLHEVKEFTYRPNMFGRQFNFSADTYTKLSMSTKEVERLLGLIKRSDFVFYPINTTFGLAVGFTIVNPETKEALLTFKESQLPRNYDFNSLSAYFMQTDNVERARSLGVSIVNDRNHYDY